MDVQPWQTVAARDYKKKYWQREYAKSDLKIRRARMKAAVIAAYGGKCECCGESHSDFLTIDHIHRDGRQDRAKHGWGSSFWAHLHKIGCPRDKYRLFCMNCNFATRWGGSCPHEKMLEQAL